MVFSNAAMKDFKPVPDTITVNLQIGSVYHPQGVQLKHLELFYIILI